MGLKEITYTPGFLTHIYDGGNSTIYPVADILRALDIPDGLTYEQVGAITTLANLVVVLVRTLMSKGILTESFLENNEYNLDDLIETIEDMGGDYAEPDLTVT
jgi:hypothetical protein